MGLIITYIINLIVSNLLFDYSGLLVTYNLGSGTVIWSILSGILIPLAASYFPIKKALSENLKEALTIFNKKVTDISIQIMKLEKLGISPASTLSALLLIIMGFITYYLAPLSFFLNDFGFFLLILNFILIIMIIGLIFMLQMSIPYLEKFILYIMMISCWRDRNLKFVVEKNLEGHRKRNQKTSIMFMIALSFIIFAGCSIQLITDFIANASKNAFGGDLNIYTNTNDSLNEIALTNYMINVTKRYPDYIKNYSFATFSLEDIIGQKTYFSNLCGYPRLKQDVVGISSGLVESTTTEIYNYKELNNEMQFKKRIIEQLFR